MSDDHLVSKEEYRGYTIEVYYDSDSLDPRKDFDNLGTMVCFHRRYMLGDRHDFATPDELLEFVERDDVISLPVYLYDHSGLTIATHPFSCPWDSGLLGYIYISKEDVLKEYNRKHLSKTLREKAKRILEGEVKEYDLYLTGQVYGYVVEDEDGEHVDSCWGYFGNPEESGLMDDARKAAKYHEAERIKNSFREYCAV